MNVLIAVDLSNSTLLVIEKAKALANLGSNKLWLLHVASPNPDFVGYEAGPQTVRDAVAEEYHEEHRKLQEWAKTLRSAPYDCIALLVPGPVAETVLAEAEKLSADLIVVGSHGRGRVSQLILGSTSEAVIRHATVPILVVPTHHQPLSP